MQTTHGQTTTEGAIWGRLLAPEDPTFSAEVARALLEFEFSREDKERMNELAAKAREGPLTASEQDEVDCYGRVGSVLGILKSKARRSLKRAGK
jgi:hypothetical protein